MQNPILDLAFAVSRATEDNISLIESVTKQTSLLAINARIEAARAGAAGSAFGVVASQMGEVSGEIARIADVLRCAVRNNLEKLENVGAELTQKFRGTRYADLAANAIEIIDRNLYERSCDVRWWATDSAVVDVAKSPSPSAIAHACERLATILRAYTVYLDLWVADADGRVIASGRGGKYPGVRGLDVSSCNWFAKAMRTASGDDFVACDIVQNPALGDASVATYATAVREEGRADGRPVGALGIFFDWAPQARAVLNGIALAPEERARTRTMIMDSQGRIIACSDEAEIGATFRIKTRGKRGYYVENDRMVAYALTPGYETYEGLGWYGVVDAPAQG